MPIAISTVSTRNSPRGPAAASRGVTRASSAAQTRATAMIVPWAVDRRRVGNDSCVHTLRMASKAKAPPMAARNCQVNKVAMLTPNTTGTTVDST